MAFDFDEMTDVVVSTDARYPGGAIFSVNVNGEQVCWPLFLNNAEILASYPDVQDILISRMKDDFMHNFTDRLWGAIEKKLKEEFSNPK